MSEISVPGRVDYSVEIIFARAEANYFRILVPAKSALNFYLIGFIVEDKLFYILIFH